MLKLEIPGRATIELESLLVDYNGTIAADGKVLPGVAERLAQLAQVVNVYVLTADTCGTAAQQCQSLPVQLETYSCAGASVLKQQFAQNLGNGVVAIGNGHNDILMFDAASLSIIVMEKEGCCVEAIAHADLMTSSILDALDLLLQPHRLRATWRI